MGYCIKGQPPDDEGDTISFMEQMFGPIQPWQKAVLKGIMDPLPYIEPQPPTPESPH